jgi:hypothetical protein
MDFSESSFLRNQGLEWNETSAVGGTGTLWDDIYDGVYFAATEWKTIDKGLNRIAEAFHPIVDNRLSYGRRVEALSFNETTGKTGVHWREDGQKKSSDYDKTIVAVPFSIARLWKTPTLSPTMTEAIGGLGYSFACKISVSHLISQCAYSSCCTRPVSGSTLILQSTEVVARPIFPVSDPSATLHTTSMVPVQVLSSLLTILPPVPSYRP